MSLARKLLFSLLTLLLFLLAAELGLRAVGYPPVAENPQLEHPSVYWQDDPNWVDKPVLHKEYAPTTFPVSTDENGLRAPLHGVHKPAGVFRVMALGCSTTYGWGVKNDESYPARLEHYLRASGRENIEVINAGQPGYTTFQGLWLWDGGENDISLAEYEPDVVLVGYVVQDAREVAYSDKSQALIQGEAAFLKRNILWNSQLYRALKVLLGDVQVRAKDELQRVYRVGDRDYLENLRGLVQRIEAAGAQPVFFGFPLEVEGYTAYHRKLLRAEAEDKGIPHFDPSPEIARLVRNKTLYFPKDRGHANIRGCDTIGEMVANYLIEQELVP